MDESKSLYKQILKSTTLFGSVQVFNIILSVIRSKTIALFIGPDGMGIAGLLTSAINLISGFTSLGIETSAVKFISQEDIQENNKALHKVAAVVKKLAWLTGTLGALIALAFSVWLSELSFGSRRYAGWFAWLSVTLLFKQLSAGQLALLQGFQKLHFLAKANFFGSLFGLLISIPFYYYLRIDAIVPAIIISSLTSLYFSWFYSRKISIDAVKIPIRQILTEGKGMLKLGIMLSLSGVITTAVAYIIQIYITSKGGLTEVGLYNAGFMLLNSYVGLIFTSMATDYFPRLASISENNAEVRTTVTHQATISVLIITPVIVLFLAFAPVIIGILYSAAFTGILPMIYFGILGMLFRAVSWSMGYILLAKGDSKMFIRTAFGFNALFFALHIVGYFFYGLAGLGAAFSIHYFFHFVILKWLTSKRYDFYFNMEFSKIFGICILICGISFLVTFIESVFLKYAFLTIMVLVANIFSYITLDKKINFLQILKSKLKRK